MISLLDIARNDNSLRQYQVQSKIEIYKAWETTPSVMFQMPTGTGKTRLFASIIKDTQTLAQKNDVHRQGVIVLAHRTELIEQIDETLSNKYNIAHGIIKAGFEEEFKFPVQVASVQTISRRLEKWGKKSFSYIIIDEAHHALAKTYRKICDAFPGVKILGVTATPYRLSGESFRDLFGKLIVSQSVEKFIEQGYLSQYEYYSIKPNSIMQNVIDNIDEFGSDGDYKEEALMSACDKDSIRASLVESYQKFARGKKGIIYTICRAHNEHVCKAFEDIGLRTVTIDSDTPTDERKKKVKDFRNGKIDIICNVNIFSEGFDCPDIEFIQLARPTMSLSMYLQQVGRGLRPCQGKNGAIILDNVGLYNRFGLPSANRQWRRHFEGKADVDNNNQSAFVTGTGKSRTPDLSEGDEDLELIYSFGNLAKQPNSDVSSDFSELLDAVDSAQHFPIGVVGYINTLKQRAKEAEIQNRNDTSDLILKLLNPSYNDLDKFESKEDWVKYVEKYFSENIEFDDNYDEIESMKDETVIFRFRGKYGIGRRTEISTLSEAIITSGNSHISINDVFDTKLDPVFDEIRIPDSYDNCICIKEGKAGLIDGYSMTEILPFRYEDIKTYGRELFVVKNHGKYGIILSGKEISRCEYDEIIPQPSHFKMFGRSFICIKQNLMDFFDTSDEPCRIQSHVQPVKALNHKYSVANGPNNMLFITDQAGHILLPFLVTEIKEVKHEQINFIASIGDYKLYLDSKLGILDEDEMPNNIKAGKVPITKIIRGTSLEKQKDTQAQETKIKTPRLKEGTNVIGTKIVICHKGVEISTMNYLQIKRLGLPGMYIIYTKSGCGVVKLEKYSVRDVLRPIYKSIDPYSDDIIILTILLGNIEKKYLYNINNGPLNLIPVSYVGKINNHTVYITTNKSQPEFVIDGEYIDPPFAEIEHLFDSIFKYRDDEFWGILRVDDNGELMFLKDAEYSEIKVRSDVTKQLILSKPGERSRLVTLK